MGEGIYDELTDELKQVPCPAGDPIGDVLGTITHVKSGVPVKSLPNTPGVRCRITHDTLSVEKDANALVRWCCNPDGGDGGYNLCPVFQYDKDRIERGQKSMGDEDEAHTQNERTWREDLTGSEYGDLSFMEAIDDAVDEAVEVMHEKGRERVERGGHPAEGGTIGGSATGGIPQP